MIVLNVASISICMLISLQPHEDGNLFYPTVSTITLGSHSVLDFYKHIQHTSAASNDSDIQHTSISTDRQTQYTPTTAATDSIGDISHMVRYRHLLIFIVFTSKSIMYAINIMGSLKICNSHLP